MNPNGGTARQVEELLVTMQGELLNFVRGNAGEPLLRWESAEDLAQGLSVEALHSKERLEWRGEEEARAWLFRIARRFLSDRRAYWSALKRDSGALLRLDATRGSASSTGTGHDPAASQTGASTFAFRREQLVIATKALALLMPRDRKLVRWSTTGVEPAEQAERLGLTIKAADKARERALERFRKAFELARRQAMGGSAPR